MKIGNYELTPEENIRLNQIVSTFFATPCTVIEVELPPEGRNRDDKHYVLNVDGKKYVSVKRAHSNPEDVKWELFMAEMRPILGIPHYKLEKGVNFPLPTWANQDYVIMEWGNIDKRFPISDPRVHPSLGENKEKLLIQLGHVAVQNYLFATSDRKQQHFVWDLDDKTLFSIDHEIPSTNENEVLDYFRNELRARFGDNWFDNDLMRGLFLAGLHTVWSVADYEKSKIISSYSTLGLNAYSNKFSERLARGCQPASQRILS